MYPRNAASPERIAIGQVVLIADGTVQTSGVSVVVRAQGGSESAGGGTISYGASSNIVYYIPTQAETNYTSFVVTAYKASCFSVSQTVVTTASATPGKVVLSGETHTSAVIPTVSVLSGHTAQTGDNYATLASGIAGETRNTNLLDQLKTIISVIEIQRGSHTHQPIGSILFVDPVNGDTHANGNRGGISDPYLGVQDCHDNAVTDSMHDLIILLSGDTPGPTTLTEDVTLSKRYLSIRGPGRDFIWTRSGAGDTISVTADGVGLEGFQLNTAATGSGKGVQLTDADFLKVKKLWVNNTRGDGINILRGENCIIKENVFTDTGQSGSGQGVHVSGTAGQSNGNSIQRNKFRNCAGDAILISNGTTNDTHIVENYIEGSSGWGINVGASSADAQIYDNFLGNNSSGNINDDGTTTLKINNEQWGVAGDAMTLTAEATSAQLVDDIWDELLTGATHNVPTSSGRRLRSVGDVTSGTVNDASATTTSFISTLTGSHDEHFSDQTLFFTDGDLSGMSRIITTYTASTKVITFDEPLPAPPGDGDGFDVNPVHVHTQSQIADVVWNEVISKASYNIGQSAAKILRQGGDLVQIDGAVSDVSPTVGDFDTNLTQSDGYFDDAVLIFSNGSANAGIGRPVSAYLNTNGNMTFAEPDDWPVTPVNGDDFVIYATHVHPVAQISAQIMADLDSNGSAVIDELTAQGDTNETKIDAVPTVVENRQEMDSNSTQLNTTLPALINDLNDPTAAAIAAAIAAAVATYDMGNGRTIEEALAFLRNKWTIIGGVLTVYDTDDISVLWTSAMTQTAGDPVSASDPT